MTVWDKMRLDGRRAMVTGGSRGLGRAMAQAFAEAGADLLLVGREQSSLASAQADLMKLDRRVDILVSDLSTPDETQRTCETVLSRHGPIDILVNNVGGRRIDVAIEETSLEEWQRMMDLNLTSMFLCTKLIGGAMLTRRQGRIINVASICAQVATKGIRGRHYETAKTAVWGFTRSVAADWAPHGITVNAIAPGVFLTDPNRRWFAERSEFQDELIEFIPMGRFGRPDEIGPLALYLASDACSYMTGALLTIDGGYTLW